MKLAAIIVCGFVGCHVSHEHTYSEKVTIIEASSPVIVDAGVDAPVVIETQITHEEPSDGGCQDMCQMPTRTLVVGDSEAGYCSRRLKEIKRPGETIEADFKSGTTIQYWAAQGNFKKVLDRHQKPDTVVIFLGTNNYWQKDVPDVRPILDEVTRRGIKCVWVGPTEVHGQHLPINPKLKAAVEPVCTYVDTEALSIPLEDGVHPTHAGIMKWLRAIWRVK